MTELEALYPNVTDCFAMEKQIQLIKNDIGYYYANLNSGEAKKRELVLREKQELFKILQCPSKMLAKRESDSKQVYDKFANSAKTRIILDASNTKKTYIAIIALTLLASGFIILKNKK